MIWFQRYPDIIQLSILGEVQLLTKHATISVFFHGMGLGQTGMSAYLKQMGEHHALKVLEKYRGDPVPKPKFACCELTLSK